MTPCDPLRASSEKSHESVGCYSRACGVKGALSEKLLTNASISTVCPSGIIDNATIIQTNVRCGMENVLRSSGNDSRCALTASVLFNVHADLDLGRVGYDQERGQCDL